MNTRNFLLADIIYAQHLWLCLVQAPTLLAVQVLHYLLCQCDGCTRGSIQFVYMMGLYHIHVILVELVHNLSQILVDSTEDGHTNAEVAGPEKSLAFRSTSLAHLSLMILHPTG